MMMENNKVVGRIKDDGFAVIDNYCDDDVLNALRLEVNALVREKPAYIKNHAMTQGESFLLNMVPARVQGSIEGTEGTTQIRGLFEKGVLPAIITEYLGQGWGVSNFIYHKATVEEFGTQELFPLHFDNFQGCLCLKGFLYLEDCAVENGALRFIPGTHNLVRKVLRLNPGASSSTHENRLDVFLDVIDRTNLNAFTQDEKCLIGKLKEVLADPKESLKYAIERKAGSLVLFDTIGIHGGVSVARGERWIARFHLVDRNYRFWNHPEQEDFLMGLFSRFCRKVKRIAG